MNDLFVDGLVEMFQVGNFQCTHRFDRLTQRFISPAVPSQSLSRCPKDPEYLCPIETLPFTVVAEAHRVPRFGWMAPSDWPLRPPRRDVSSGGEGARFVTRASIP